MLAKMYKKRICKHWAEKVIKQSLWETVWRWSFLNNQNGTNLYRTRNSSPWHIPPTKQHEFQSIHTSHYLHSIYLLQRCGSNISIYQIRIKGIDFVMWYIPHLSHKEWNLPFAQPWMDLEGIVPSEISQTEKGKCCMIPLKGGSKKHNNLVNTTGKKQTHRPREQTSCQ